MRPARQLLRRPLLSDATLSDLDLTSRPTGEDRAEHGTRRLGALALVAAVGVVGSTLTAWSAWRAGALVAPHVRWLHGVAVLGRVPMPSALAASWCWPVGLLVLSTAWFLLRRLSLRGAVSVTGVLVTAGLWMAPLVVAPPVGTRDVYSYVAHGALARSGLDPGVHPPADLGAGPVLAAVAPVWRHVVTAYGPLATVLSRVAVAVAGDRIDVAVVVWRLFALAGVALLAVGVAVLARANGRDRADALVLAVAGPLTVVQLVGGVHNEALMVGLMACGLALAAARPGRAGLAGGIVLCGLAAAVKVPALLGAAYLGWTGGGAPLPPARPALRTALRPGRWGARFVGAAVAVVAALAVVAVAGLAAGAGWGWVHGMGVGGRVVTFLGVTTTLGLLVAWLTGHGHDSTSWPVDIAHVIGTVVSVVLAAALLVATPALGLAGLGAAFAALALLGPAVHPWYLTWSLPALAVVWAGRRVWWPMALGVLAAAATRPQGGGVWPNLAQQPWRLALVVLAAVAALVARQRWRARKEPAAA